MQSLNGDGLSLERPEKGTGFPGTGVTGRCGLLYVLCTGARYTRRAAGELAHGAISTPPLCGF